MTISNKSLTLLGGLLLLGATSACEQRPAPGGWTFDATEGQPDTTRPNKGEVGQTVDAGPGETSNREAGGMRSTMPPIKKDDIWTPPTDGDSKPRPTPQGECAEKTVANFLGYCRRETYSLNTDGEFVPVHQVAQQHNAHGQLVRRIIDDESDRSSSPDGVPDEVIGFLYDEEGRPDKKVEFLSGGRFYQRTVYTHGERHRLQLSERYPEGGVYSRIDYSYDDRGNQIEQTVGDSKNEPRYTNRYSYDGECRVVKKTHQRAGESRAERTIQYEREYRKDGGLIIHKRYATRSDDSVSAAFKALETHRSGRLASEKRWIRSPLSNPEWKFRHKLIYEYDRRGRRRQIRYYEEPDAKSADTPYRLTRYYYDCSNR